MSKDWIQDHWQDLIVIVLFIIGFYVRVNLNGIHYDGPGNVKASDPVYHVLIADHIGKTGDIGHQPSYMSLGHTDVIDMVPPLQSILAGSLLRFMDTVPWNIYWFFVSLFSAFSVVLIYLLADKLTGSKNAALAASLLITVPLNISRWYYFLYIGIWPQNSIFTLILFCSYISLLYLEKPDWKMLVAVGIGNGAVFLLHFSELFLLLPLNLYLIYSIIKRKKEEWSKKLRNLAILGGPGLVLMILGYATLLLLRGASVPTAISVHVPDFNALNYIIKISDISQVYLVFATLGLVYLFRHKRWKETGYIIYYTMLTFVMPYLVNNEHYFLRMRLFAIFPLALVVGYGMNHLSEDISKMIPKAKVKDARSTSMTVLVSLIVFFVLNLITSSGIVFNNTVMLRFFVGFSILAVFIGLVVTIGFMIKKKFKTLALSIMVVLFFGIIAAMGVPGYLTLKKGLSGTSLPEVYYDGYEWIQENTDTNDSILFIGSDGQQEDNFMKRTKYNPDIMYIIQNLDTYFENASKGISPPMMYPGRWSGFTSWTNLAYKDGFFSLAHHELPNKPESMLKFKYIYLEHRQEEQANFNFLLAQVLMEDHGYVLVFNNPVVIILKNEKI